MNPYAALAAIALVIAVFFGGMQHGKKMERQVWQAEKVELQEAQRKEMLAEMGKRARQQEFNQAIARKATEAHDKALTEIAKRHKLEVAAVRSAGGLRIPAGQLCARTSAAGTQAAGAGGPDEGAAATVKLPDRIETGLFALVERADELAEQLRALQGWVRDNGFYGPPPTASPTHADPSDSN